MLGILPINAGKIKEMRGYSRIFADGHGFVTRHDNDYSSYTPTFSNHFELIIRENPRVLPLRKLLLIFWPVDLVIFSRGSQQNGEDEHES